MNLATYCAQLSDEKQPAASILQAIAQAGQKISHEVQRSGLLNLHGAAGGENIQGEFVQILDERSNTYMKETLSSNPHVAVIASEEEDSVIVCGDSPGYAVAFDPLDGSSNIDINASVGTIFSILPADTATETALLQPGKYQVGAGYILYGSSTVLVFSVGDVVTEFTLDQDSGEFIQTIESIRYPQRAGYISFNPAMLPVMQPADEARFRAMLYEDERSARYIGAMVADVHRTLLKGGVFAYPEIKKGDKYEGKLRLQYEVKPLGWLVSKAGAPAFIGDTACDEFAPSSLHERVGIVLGA